MNLSWGDVFIAFHKIDFDNSSDVDSLFHTTPLEHPVRVW